MNSQPSKELKSAKSPGYVLVKEIFIKEFLNNIKLSIAESQELFDIFWTRLMKNNTEKLPKNTEAAEIFYFNNIRENQEYLSNLLITEYDYRARRLEQKANEI